MIVRGNIVFWYAVAVVVLFLFALLVREIVLYLRKHGKLAELQTDYQRLTNAYAAWRRVLTPLIAQGVPIVEAVLKPLVKALIVETGLPESTLIEIGAELLHTLQQGISGQPVAPPTPPPLPAPSAAPTDPAPAAAPDPAPAIPPEAGTPPAATPAVATP